MACAAVNQASREIRVACVAANRASREIQVACEALNSGLGIASAAAVPDALKRQKHWTGCCSLCRRVR